LRLEVVGRALHAAEDELGRDLHAVRDELRRDAAAVRAEVARDVRELQRATQSVGEQLAGGPAGRLARRLMKGRGGAAAAAAAAEEESRALEGCDTADTADVGSVSPPTAQGCFAPPGAQYGGTPWRFAASVVHDLQETLGLPAPPALRGSAAGSVQGQAAAGAEAGAGAKTLPSLGEALSALSASAAASGPLAAFAAARADHDASSQLFWATFEPLLGPLAAGRPPDAVSHVDGEPAASGSQPAGMTPAEMASRLADMDAKMDAILQLMRSSQTSAAGLPRLIIAAQTTTQPHAEIVTAAANNNDE